MDEDMAADYQGESPQLLDVELVRKMQMAWAKNGQGARNGQLPNPSECPQAVNGEAVNGGGHFFDLTHDRDSPSNEAQRLRQESEAQRLRQKMVAGTFLNEPSNDVQKLRQENEALKQKMAEINVLRASSASSSDELSAQNERLVVEAKLLREENQRLNVEVRRLQANGAAAAMASELEKPVNDVSPPAGTPPNGDHSEGRLRLALSRQGTTTNELRQAIRAVESLVDEATRELGNAQLRERRAAFEALHAAIGDSKGDEEALEEAIEKARLADVEKEDVQKGEAKLAELRSMTPEQKAKKAAHQLEAQRKKEAFILIKRDDAEGLEHLLDDLAEDVRWQDWRDYAGRSLWRCAVDLRATRVQAFIAPLVGQQLPGESKSGLTKRPSNASVHAVRGSVISVPESLDEERPSVGSPTSRPSIGPGSGRGSIFSAGALLRQSSTGSDGFLLDTSPTANEDLGSDSPPPPAALSPGESPNTPRADGSASPSKSSTGEHAESSVPSPAKSDAEYAQLKVAAFRAAAQDDCESLVEVLESVHVDIWSKWENKAGKDLLTLSTERGSSMAYGMLAGELGLLKEVHRDVFEERESIWIFKQGEVQPRRATVLEDTPAEQEEVLIEFWDGDDPPIRVERCLIHKMYG